MECFPTSTATCPGMFRLSEGEAEGMGVGGLNGGHIYDVDARSQGR